MAEQYPISEDLGWSPRGNSYFDAYSAARRVDAFGFNYTFGELGQRRAIVSIVTGSNVPTAAQESPRIRREVLA